MSSIGFFILVEVGGIGPPSEASRCKDFYTLSSLIGICVAKLTRTKLRAQRAIGA